MNASADDVEVKEPTKNEKHPDLTPSFITPDGGWGWFVVFGSMLTHIIIGGQERANGILYLAIVNKFDSSATITAVLLSFTTAFQLLCGPISGAVIKRFSGGTVGFVGGLLLFLSFLFSSLTTSVEFLFITYAFLGGLAKSLSYTSSIIMVGYYFDKKRGIAVGLTTAGVGIGTFIYAPLMEWSFKTYSFFGTMIILGALALNLCVCGLLYRPLRKKEAFLLKEANESSQSLNKDVNFDSLQTSDSSSTSPTNVDEQKTIGNSSWQKFSSFLSEILHGLQTGFDFQLLRNLHFLFFCFNICLFTSSHWTIPVFLPALSLEKGIKVMESALLISIIGISDLISRIVMGLFLDLKWVKPYRRFIFTTIIGLQVIMMFSCSYAKRFWEFALVCVAYGSLSGGTIAQLSIIVVDLLGVEKLASSFGWTLCFQGIGILIGPPLAGQIRDAYKNYSMVYSYAGGMMFAGLLFLLTSAVLYWWEKKKNKSTESD